MQNGIIQEYRVWCVGSGGDNQTRYYINRTVDGDTLSTALRGLVPGVLYQLEVAAVTSAGVGARSQPLSVLIKLPAEAPSAPGGGGPSDGSEESSVSLAEQITDVVKQPAFIAGIGGACWVILMGFSVWIYCRRKKRKELSHYTASFNYTPAVGFPHVEGAGLNGRPGVLGGSMGNYPWLADSWPTTNLVHSGKEAVTCCTANHDTAERYYNEAGISNYLNQTEKYSMGGSTEGPIYSTIDATNEEMHGFTYAQHTSPIPYASTSITPCPTHTQGSHNNEQQEEGHWIPQPGPSGAQYAQPDRCTGKPKQKAMGKAVKTPSLTWMEALPPPPPIGELEQCEPDDQPPEHEDMDIGSDEEWCPPLPERTYLMEGCEDGPSPLHRNTASSPATSYSHQSTATLTPSPHEEPRGPHDPPRLSQADQQLSRYVRRLANHVLTSKSKVTQDPKLFKTHWLYSPVVFSVTRWFWFWVSSPPQQKVGLRSGASSPGPQPSAPPPPPPASPASSITAHRRLARCSARAPPPAAPTARGRRSTQTAAALHRCTVAPPQQKCALPPNQKSRVKKKVSKSSAYRRDAQGDLPPPPEPPPGGERLQGLQGSMEASNAVNVALSSLERSEYSSQRKGSAHRHIENEDLLPYSSKVLHLSRSQMSSNCSTTGSSSSRGSTGSRGPPSARKYTEEMR
ncbi:hypothetical protein CgunFtcFv8_003464 [Champsocephalus gunnari]|uniref:Fibronectin type-III domain-containing protein n=1 Tax=Champsocephalus gunnari TaxID=52237 RepID=A0AAN8HKI0_CHAGU|nr:hypothetical protein CgunFtcFv8_003464 [Champsocephalus gunnari]